MEINAYLRPLLRWWRLVAILTALTMITSAISTLFQPDVYISKTTLIVGSTSLDPNPDQSQLYTSAQLASFYADMASREPIKNATTKSLGIDFLPQYVVVALPNSQLLEISVTDTNPKRAQIVADELARQLMQQSPVVGDTETGDRQEFIRQQLSSLQIQIRDTQNKIDELQASLAGLNSASQIANVEQEIRDQTANLNDLRRSYADFLSNSQERALNILSVVEPANLPTDPAGANLLLIVVLAGLMGFSLGVGSAYLLEYLDRTIKTTSDVERVFNLPVIGYISEISENEDRATYVIKNPNSILAENFRLLKSNIEFFQTSNLVKTILITSPSQGNGKTTIATNLALSISSDEQSVILVDADLRRPAVHRALSIDIGPGVAEVIRNKADITSVVRNWNNKNLNVITAGNIPSNVTEVVGSKRIGAIFGQLKEKSEVVIVDAPPLAVSDTYSLASRADGVILVLEMGQTTEEQAKTIKEQLSRVNARLLGIVFNKVSEDGLYSHFDFQYRSLASSEYYGDYVTDATKKINTGSRSKKIMAFFEHGEVPSEIEEGVQSAITAIRTQPRNMVNRIKKPRKNIRSGSKDNGKDGDESKAE